MRAAQHCRSGSAFAALVFALSLVAGSGRGAERQTADTNAVMAAYLHLFPAHVKWPASTFTSTNESWRIGVLGPDPFGDTLEQQILLGESNAMSGRTFEIWHADKPEDLPPCQIVFIAFKDEAQIKTALDAMTNQPVLTVGESENFLALGGIIQLKQRDDYIRWSINRDRARAAKLVISPKLLGLAVEIIENGVRKTQRKKLP